MNFNDYIEIDTASKSILLLSYSEGNNEILIKVNEKEIKELKLKQEFIQFFTCNEDFSNPLAAEFKIDIYFNNYIVSYEVTGENSEEIKKFYEYVKSLLI